MKSDAERAPLFMRRQGMSLVPTGAFPAARLEQYADGSIVEVTLKRRRSNPQNALYWATLAKVVTATDAYPTAEALHEALKMDLGYTVPIKTLDGKIFYLPDSTAFAKMDQAGFKRFFDQAMLRLAETFGFDPLAEAA